MEPNKKPMSERLSDAYEMLITTTKALQNAAELAKTRRRLLTAEETAIRLKYANDPKLLGGNDKAREATIREMTTAAREGLEDAEKSQCNLQGMHEVARLEVEHLQWQIRLMELMPPEATMLPPEIILHQAELRPPTTQTEINEAILELVGQDTVYAECGGDFKPDSNDCLECSDFSTCNYQARKVQNTKAVREMIRLGGGK